MFAASKKRVTVVIAILGAIALSTAAYAYWTQGGSGTGEATTGDTVALTVEQDTVLSAMYPGDSAQGITVFVKNPNAASIQVDKVTASVTDVITTPVGGDCEPNDFTLAGADMTAGAGQVPGNDGTVDGSRQFDGASIKFKNEAAEDQNDCKNAVVKLKYTIVG